MKLVNKTACKMSTLGPVPGFGMMLSVAGKIRHESHNVGDQKCWSDQSSHDFRLSTHRKMSLEPCSRYIPITHLTRRSGDGVEGRGEEKFVQGEETTKRIMHWSYHLKKMGILGIFQERCGSSMEYLMRNETKPLGVVHRAVGCGNCAD